MFVTRAQRNAPLATRRAKRSTAGVNNWLFSDGFLSHEDFAELKKLSKLKVPKPPKEPKPDVVNSSESIHENNRNAWMRGLNIPELDDKRPGLYCISTKETRNYVNPSIYKLGASENLAKRLYSYHGYYPLGFDIHFIVLLKKSVSKAQTLEVEKAVHAKLDMAKVPGQVTRVSERHEWFINNPAAIEHAILELMNENETFRSRLQDENNPIMRLSDDVRMRAYSNVVLLPNVKLVREARKSSVV